MSLVGQCVECGKDASHGRRVDTTRQFSPRWVWWGLAIGLVTLIPFYFLGRKTLRLSYSLCPECDRAEKRRKWTAVGAWLLVVASALVSVQLDDAWILIATGVLFATAVVASVRANTSLLVSGYTDQVFTIKGVSEAFLAVRGTSSP
jgi:hypothetical protein